MPDAGPLAPQIEQSFLRRFASLSATSQQLLLLAAAEPLGDVTLLWRAAEQLGIGRRGARRPGGRRARGGRRCACGSVTRWCARRCTGRRPSRTGGARTGRWPTPRIAEADPDRRAWHRAYAAAGLDESVAGDLERSAGARPAAGRGRGGRGVPGAGGGADAGAAARGRTRTLAAAQAKLEAGAPDAAERAARRRGAGAARRAAAARSCAGLRAEVAFTVRRGGDVAALLLDAATGLVRLDARLARKTCLEALGAALHAGDVIDRRDGAGGRARRRRRPASPAAATTCCSTGWRRGSWRASRQAAPPLRAALEAFRGDDGGDAEVDRWLWLACRAAADLWDIETWSELAQRAVRLAREAGALDVLPIAATYRAGAHMHRGEYGAAATLMDESSAITAATGAAPLVLTKPVLAARRGDPAASVPLLERARQDTAARGLGMPASMLDATRAALFNALGRYEEALEAAERGCDADELSLYAGWAGRARRGRRRTAGDRRSRRGAFERLRARTQASGTDWALGLEARSQALLTDGAAAGALYEEAIARLARADVAPYLARAQLVYGEWLRREQRRREAREQLRRGARHASSAWGGGVGRARPPRARGDRRDRSASARWRRATR